MKFFIILAFISLTYTLTAQDIEVTPNPVHDWETIDEAEILGDAVIKNNSAEVKTYTWERTVISNVNNIDTWFCDPNVCYTPATNSASFTLNPGEEGPFQLHANFTSEERALKVQIKVYENGNETNFVDAIYELELEVVGTETVAINEIKLFPNPTTDHFTLTNIGNVKTLVIHNIIGAPLKQYLAEENASYSISDLPEGVYMVQLIDTDGNNVGNKRIFKQ